MNFKNKLMLAPLEGVTCMPYRLLCKRYKADIVVSEMVNAKAIINAAKKINNKLATCEEEKPVGIQIAAADADSAVKAAKIIEDKADFIDINMGCPSTTIMNSGCGAYLLSKPDKIAEIVSSVVKSVNIPVTVKMRADNAVRNAKIIEENGASAITIHARTIKQKGSGIVDFEILKNVKAAVKIPVIGNGGVCNAETAHKMLEVTDSAMIGTAALGNPGVFSTIKGYKTPSQPEQFLELYELADSLKMAEFKWLKSIAPYFIAGVPGAARLRLKLNTLKTEKELLEAFKPLKT